MSNIIIKKYLNVKLGETEAYIFSIQIKELLPIYYVAVRGKDDVQGAVQRVLNKRRISSIKEFVLDGNTFFNLFILNWADDNYAIEAKDGNLIIPQISSAAQVIDGQHRLEGLKQAYEEDENVGEKEIIVLMTQHLTTPDAAKIFLNINTEQKPVPNSLVYDLFGEVKAKDYYIVRATDIAVKLHEDKESPYYQCIKMPGAATGKVDLSTVVNSLKQFTKDDGIFAEYHLQDLEAQHRIIFNFFAVIRSFYEKEGIWLKSNNPFMTNAGCFSGIEFMCRELLPKCAEKKSFEQSTIKTLLPLEKEGLLYKDEIRNKQGKEQRNIVYQYLRSVLLKDVPSQNEYKF